MNKHKEQGVIWRVFFVLVVLMNWNYSHPMCTIACLEYQESLCVSLYFCFCKCFLLRCKAGLIIQISEQHHQRNAPMAALKWTHSFHVWMLMLWVTGLRRSVTVEMSVGEALNPVQTTEPGNQHTVPDSASVSVLRHRVCNPHLWLTQIACFSWN